MTKLPRAYAWLDEIDAPPRTIVEARRLYGTLEAPGTPDNPVIIRWALEVGGKVEDVYKADSIPWCGLFAAVVCHRADKAFPANALWALSWSAFGKPVDRPGLGDVLVFKRPGGGHVGFYVGEDATAYHVLGGNQSDAVTITRIAKSRLYAARRPTYRVQPKSVRPYMLAGAGALSLNEA